MRIVDKSDVMQTVSRSGDSGIFCAFSDRSISATLDRRGHGMLIGSQGARCSELHGRCTVVWWRSKVSLKIVKTGLGKNCPGGRGRVRGSPGGLASCRSVPDAATGTM
jgi:hypothetical protein